MNKVYFIQANISGEDYGIDTITIGLFSTIDKVIVAIRIWIKEERDGGFQGDICFHGLQMTLDGPQERLDFSNDAESKSLIKQFRDIEKEFPIVEDN